MDTGGPCGKWMQLDSCGVGNPRTTGFGSCLAAPRMILIIKRQAKWQNWSGMGHSVVRRISAPSAPSSSARCFSIVIVEPAGIRLLEIDSHSALLGLHIDRRRLHACMPERALDHINRQVCGDA